MNAAIIEEEWRANIERTTFVRLSKNNKSIATWIGANCTWRNILHELSAGGSSSLTQSSEPRLFTLGLKNSFPLMLLSSDG